MSRRAGWGKPFVVGRTTDEVNLAFHDPGLDVTARIKEVHGLPEIVALEIKPLVGVKDAWPLTSDLIRQIPLRQMKDSYLGPRTHEGAFGPFKRPARRGPRPADHYEQVAAIYEANVGKSPLTAIQKHYGVKRAMASKYVREARERQLLGWPSREGVAGAVEKRSPYPTKAKTNKTSGRKSAAPRKGATKKGSTR